ncbi:OB-fold-containig protein [Streptosporangium carneum]|uniref:OB-fold-containig protein n=1 Tax=Streptosporangium carneum TaxID=47481 RepID=UPI0022F2E90B|nr:OB-fold-containig protein [Streptosporangium carneum]
MVVIGFWLLTAFGAIGADGDIQGDGGETGVTGGLAGLVRGLGLGGVPVSVVVSLLVIIAWFASLVGGVLLAGTPALAAVPFGAVACAWVCTRLIVLPLRRAVPKERVPSRNDFVGRTCVIRTGRVSGEFGQAEVTAADGSSALVQVRQTGDDVFGAGSTALIFAYDAAGEFFWVMPYAAELDPDRPI